MRTLALVLCGLTLACSGAIGDAASEADPAPEIPATAGTPPAGPVSDERPGPPPGTLAPTTPAPTTPAPTPARPAPAGDCRGRAVVRRLDADEYRNTVAAVFEGKVSSSGRYPGPSPELSATRFTSDARALPVTVLGLERIAEAAFEVAAAVVDRLPALLPCAASAPSERCAAQFLDTFGARAFRRPLTADERARLLALHRTVGASSFADGVGAMTAALLQMPGFLYLELGDGAGGAPSPQELASRLSYLLLDAPPDAPLEAAVASGRLRTAEGMRAEALRLLRDPRARPVLGRFVREWLGVKALKSSDKKNEKVFTPEVAAAVGQELEQVAVAALLADAPALSTLLTSPRTFANPPLRAFYGLPATSAGGFVEVTPDGGRRSGVLTAPAVMASLAHEAQTSYVERGLLVRRGLLCEVLPAPPEDALSLVPPFPPNATERRKSETIRALPACGACHGLIDPVGLAFEEYDELGRRRTAALDGGALDVGGDVPGGPPGVAGPFRGVAELGARLARSPAVAACLARHFFEFAHHRPSTPDDRCALDRLTDRFTIDAPFATLVEALVEGDELRDRGGAR